MYLEYNPQNDAGTLLNDITGKKKNKQKKTQRGFVVGFVTISDVMS